MRRRTFLTTGTAGIALAAGCLGNGSDGPGADDGATDDSGSTDDGDRGGYEAGSATDPDPDLSEVGYPTEPDPDLADDLDPLDPSQFGSVESNGYEVPVVPVETAAYWYHTEQARFLDARTQGQYDDGHVPGAYLSPPRDTDAPELSDWAETDRVLAYCDCPIARSAFRASELYQEGFTAIYALEDQFLEWEDAGYPIVGETTASRVQWTIDGQVDPGYAGEVAELFHGTTAELLYLSEIAADGTFSLVVSGADVDGTDAPVRLETPSFVREASLDELASGTVE